MAVSSALVNCLLILGFAFNIHWYGWSVNLSFHFQINLWGRRWTPLGRWSNISREFWQVPCIVVYHANLKLKEKTNWDSISKLARGNWFWNVLNRIGTMFFLLISVRNFVQWLSKPNINSIVHKELFPNENLIEV